MGGVVNSCRHRGFKWHTLWQWKWIALAFPPEFVAFFRFLDFSTQLLSELHKVCTWLTRGLLELKLWWGKVLHVPLSRWPWRDNRLDLDLAFFHHCIKFS
ncbi:hypothetical protein D3C87_1565400 [compost metagenome]